MGLQLAQRWAQNFPRWDGNGDGHIEPRELYTQVGLAQASADDAAALATLYREVLHESRGLEQMPSVDKSRLKAYLLTLGSRGMDLAFTHFQAKIAGLGQTLAQGSAPSCALVSSSYALMQREPDALRNMVSHRERGLQVKFPGESEAILVTALSDTEKALHTPGLEAIEKAWGLHEDPQTLAPIASARGNGVDRVITALTGNPAQTQLLPNAKVFDYLNAVIQKKRPGAPALTPPPIDPLLHDMERALAGQAIVVTGTWKEVGLAGLERDHAYTVIACDPAQQTLRLRNPHGQGEPGQDGLDDGIFSLSVQDYLSNFNSVTIEQRRINRGPRPSIAQIRLTGSGRRTPTTVTSAPATGPGRKSTNW